MGAMSALDLQKIEADLKGNTLLIYWYIIRKGNEPTGVREVQRSLDLSSPSVALHHLEKLRALGLLEKSLIGEYSLKEEVKVGFLRYFMRLGRFMLPRHLFYAVFFTTMLLTYLIIYPNLVSVHQILALIILISATIITWYETIRTSREAPF